MPIKTLTAVLRRRMRRPIMSGSGAATSAHCPALSAIRVFANGEELSGTAESAGPDGDMITYDIRGSIDEDGIVTLAFETRAPRAWPGMRRLQFAGPRNTRAFVLAEQGAGGRELQMRSHEPRGVYPGEYQPPRDALGRYISIEAGISGDGGDGGGDGGGGK